MDIWQETVSTAYLGTQRQQFRPKLYTCSQNLDNLLTHVTKITENHESALLGVSALVGMHRQAGRRLTSDGADISTGTVAHPPDTRKRPHVMAAARLGLMVNGRYKEILPEWLRMLAQMDGRVPEEWLPNLLELARGWAEIQPYLLPVLGERGCWLAAQNPDWAFFGIGNEASVWQTGTRLTRAMALVRARQRDPNAAREMLMATWDTEAPDDRNEFLSALRHNLSMDDEPFLEAALDDRDERIGRAASGLLSMLTGSRLVERMFGYARPLLSLEEFQPMPTPRFRPNNAQEPLLRIIAKRTETTSPEMLRDGIDRKGGGRSPFETADRFWVVRQMLAAVPPSRWCAALGLPAKTLIEAAHRSEAKTALLAGWEIAARNHHDETWLRALLDIHALRPEPAFGPSPVRTLIAALSVPTREAYLTAFYENHPTPLAVDNCGLGLLEASEHDWSRAFSLMVLEGLARAIADEPNHKHWVQRRRFPFGANGDNAGPMGYTLSRFALRLDPELVDLAADRLIPVAERFDAWRKAVEHFLTILRFRSEMRKDVF